MKSKMVKVKRSPRLFVSAHTVGKVKGVPRAPIPYACCGIGLHKKEIVASEARSYSVPWSWTGAYRWAPSELETIPTNLPARTFRPGRKRVKR
jgi:hypothetical protein